MSEQTKKTLKRIGIGLGMCIGAGALGLSYIGLGEILCENYHDPGRGIFNAFQSARYGWSVTLKDGWAA